MRAAHVPALDLQLCLQVSQVGHRTTLRSSAALCAAAAAQAKGSQHPATQAARAASAVLAGVMEAKPGRRQTMVWRQGWETCRVPGCIKHRGRGSPHAEATPVGIPFLRRIGVAHNSLTA